MTTAESAGYRGPDRRGERRGIVPLSRSLIRWSACGLALAVAAAVAWVLLGGGDATVATSVTSLTAPAVTTLGALFALIIFVRALLSGDARILRTSLAVLVYIGGALPISLAAVGMSAPRAFEAASFAVAGLLAVSALVTPDVDTTRPIALTAGLAFSGMFGLGALTLAAGLSSEETLRGGYLAVLVASGIAVMVCAVRNGRGALWSLGVCLLFFGAAQFVDLAAVPVTTAMCMPAVALHLAGVALLIITAITYVRAGLAARRRGDSTIRERWRSAEVAIQQEHAAAAERDHEIRNIVAGLAGATYSIAQLRGHLPTSDLQRLERAVQTEIGVLQMLVSPRGGGHPQVYDVAATLADVIDVQRTTGQRITFTAAGGLLTHGRAAALVQIVTNLLRNAATHAPGARVRVIAARQDRAIIITVADDGPGFDADEADALLGRGVRGSHASAEGSGLGLHVSAQLAADEGGSLRLEPVTGPGCTAVLELPLSEEPAAGFAVAPQPEASQS